MINSKKKGTDAERDLIHLFWKNNWAAIRAAGSGSTRYPCPDILVSNGFKIVAIEIKIINSEYKFFYKKEIEELVEFSKKFGAMPFVAVKFKSHPWLFIPVDDLFESKQGYRIKLEEGNMKGLLFEEFVDLINHV